MARRQRRCGGEEPGSNKAFSNALEEGGYKRKIERDGTRFYGIALRPDERDDDAPAAAPYWTQC